MAKPPNAQRYIDSKGLAERHGTTENTIRHQRQQKRGPPYVRFGGRIYYEVKLVEKWEAEQLKPITSNPDSLKRKTHENQV